MGPAGPCLGSGGFGRVDSGCGLGQCADASDPIHRCGNAQHDPAFECPNLLTFVFADDLSAKTPLEVVDFEPDRIAAIIPAAKVEALQPLFPVTQQVAPSQIAVGPTDEVPRRT